MTVHLVGAGPGDPGLLTRRGEELLRRADVVIYDRLVDPSLLLLAPPGALQIDVGKVPAHTPGVHTDDGGDGGTGGTGAGSGTGGAGRVPGAVRQEEINRLLVEHGRAGRCVVRLKGGDPFLFGRGGEEAEALRDAGIDWEVVPGVTSALAVPAYAGVPVTHRGLSTSVTVVTGHVGDASAPGGVDWESLGRAGGTLVVLMGMATRAVIAERLLAAGRDPQTPVLVGAWGTTPSQRTERTTLAGLAGVELGSPAVIVIGAVAGLDLGSTAPRPLAGRSVVLTRPRARALKLGAALADAGARVVELAVVETADPADGGAALRRAVDRLAGYRWIAFTSATAVHRTMALVPDARAVGGCALAAVGTATAAALGEYRLVADLVPERPSAAGLADAFPAADVPGGRVLFPRAEGARPTLAAGLRSKGWTVDDVVAYRTVVVPPPPDAVLGTLATAWAAVFASPSAVDAYVALRTVAGQALPVPPVVACVGPTTAAAARARGMAVAVQSASPEPADVVAGLVAVLGVTPSP